MGIVLPGSPKRDFQEMELRVAGAQHIIDLPGKGKHSWRDAVKLCRPGDTYYVYALVLVPTPRGEDALPPTAQVIDFVSEVHERKGVIIEVYTGRRSDDPKQKRAMIGDAVASLKSGGRGKMPAGFRVPGRKAVKWTEEQLQRAHDAWFSRDYATNEAAERHMPPGFSVTRARRLWGPSGRPWPSRRKRKT